MACLLSSVATGASSGAQPLATGSLPWPFLPERRGQLATGRDAELSVGAPEVPLDGLERDVELVGDLAVRASLSGEARDPQLARGERLDPPPQVAPWPRAEGVQLLPGTDRHRPRAGPCRQVQCLQERRRRGGPRARAAERRAELEQRAGPLEDRGGRLEHGGRAPAR